MPQQKPLAPRFEQVQVAADLKDGYWIEAVDINGDGKPDLVTSGLALGDGDDEFVVALRGPMPWQGVFDYKAVDLDHALFWKTRVSSESAARIAVADFDGDGRLDFATTGYYTPGYFLCDNPQVLVFLNRFAANVSA